MTTAAKRKKIKSAVSSTDRGGAFLLPLGALLLGFGFMLLLGATLQTSTKSLELLKNMAVGLGGAMYILVPIMIIWLGALLCVASKRYVSMSTFLLTLCLMLCIGALFTLTLRVEDRAYGNLMEYIRNINSVVKNSPYPQSMGEYLETSYHRYYGRFSDAAIYPGGGALSMLIAHPLYVMLGSVGAVLVLVILVVALVFALLRQSPASLLNAISDRLGKRQVKPQPVQQAATSAQPEPASIYQQGAGSDQAPLYQEDYPPEVPEPVPAQPVWPSNQQGAYQPPIPAYATYDNRQAKAATADGFIVQPVGGMFDQQLPDPLSHPGSGFGNATSRTQQASVEVDFASIGQVQTGRKPRSQQTEQRQPLSAHTQVPPAEVSAEKPEAMAELHQQPLPWEDEFTALQAVIEKTPNADMPDNEKSFREEPTPEGQSAQLASASVPESNVTPSPRKLTDKINPVGVGPAISLTGERVEIKRSAIDATAKQGIDGMTKKPVPTQMRLLVDDYENPPYRLLTDAPQGETADYSQEDMAKADKLLETLKSFSIPAHLHDIVHGPTVTRFAIRLAEGVNVSRLRNIMDNLTIELKAKGDIRAEMPIPGTSYVGLEVSNDKTSKVFLREVLTAPRMMENKSPTAVALGKDITGTPIICELMDMPHLLIAGATGSGKSVCINSIICSILYRASPRNVRMIMVDPKFVELQPYTDVPHLMMPVITDAKKATAALDWVCQEMDQRYQTMVDAGVRNLDAYNKKLSPDEEPLPKIIVIVDEMADLMTTSGKQIEDHIKRITAKARAAGICLILATQRPSVNIITGVIKANIPGRIAFRVASPFDSKTILDAQGAEKLLGYGDMLYRSMTRDPIRVQGCFVSDQDVEQTVAYIRSRNKSDYNLDLMEHVETGDQPENGNGGEALDGGDQAFDELLPQAIEMAVESGQMSISMLQRVLRVGYARSGRLIDEMTRRGIISGNEGTKPRRTLMTREQYQVYLEQSED